MAKRQTIWLSTMMVLSLMLIGFYTVNNNTEPVTDADSHQVVDKKVGSKDAAAVMEPSDFFLRYHLGNEEKMAERADQLEAMIASGKTPEEIDKATKDLETLHNNEEKIDNIIDQISALGHADAIVQLNEDKVNVIVQAQELDNAKAVKIMGIVAKEMQISASKVTVASHE